MREYLVAQNRTTFYAGRHKQSGAIIALGGAVLLGVSLMPGAQAIDIVISGAVILLGGSLFFNDKYGNQNFWDARMVSQRQYAMQPQRWQLNDQQWENQQQPTQQEMDWINQRSGEYR